MRLPSTDGVALAVHDLGGDGPPLLLAHATGFHGRVWAPLAEALARRFRMWSFDFRGHGDSSRPTTGDVDFDWRGFGDDVLSVVDGLGLDQPFGLGHSKGASALLLAEQARPATFRALYAYEPIAFPPPRPPLPDHPLVAGALRRREVFTSLDDAERHLAAKPPLADLAREALRAYVDHGLVPTADGSVILKCRAADEAQMYRMGLAHPAFERLGQVRCPVTLARGALSRAVAAELAELQVSRLPAGRLEVLDGLGHLGPLEDPPRVAEAVARALGPS
ncbi:MAG: alpha/beta fold hydrolase [Acidimicrobiales bacterium]